ncbi:hypothetical protein IC582_004238 [Cucumis melo]
MSRTTMGRYCSFFWSSSTRSIQSNKCFSLTRTHPVHQKPYSQGSDSDTRSYMISYMAPQHEASYEEQRQCAMVDVNDLGGLPSTKGTMIIRYLRSSRGSTSLMKVQMIMER